jgi:hypothetical protein
VKNRAAAAIVCTPLSLVLAALSLAEPANATDVLWVGRTMATIAWQPPTQGIVDAYVVLVSRNGGAEVSEQVVTAPQATLAAELGDRVSVRILSVGRATPSGPLVASVPSPSTSVQFVDLVPPVPPSGATPLMVQHCAPCQKLRLRSLSDLSQYVDRFAPQAPWRIVGRGSAAFPYFEQLWQYSDSGTLLLLSIGESASVVATTPASSTGYELAQLAELDGDPEPEIVTYSGDGSGLVFWKRKGANILPIAQMDIPPGSELVGAEDLDGNGKADLWFRWGDAGAVAVLEWTPDAVHWRGRLDTGATGEVAAIGDLDGNGKPDVLWRDDTGRLTVSYVGMSEGEVYLSRNLSIPWTPGDEKLEVKGLADLLVTPGLEIVVQNTETFAVGAIVALRADLDVRIPLLDSGPPFEVVHAQ